MQHGRLGQFRTGLEVEADILEFDASQRRGRVAGQERRDEGSNRSVSQAGLQKDTCFYAQGLAAATRQTVPANHDTQSGEREERASRPLVCKPSFTIVRFAERRLSWRPLDRACCSPRLSRVEQLSLSPPPASAAPRHHRHGASEAGVSYEHSGHASRSGYQTLVSDGPGTGFGFHRLPGGYRVDAAAAQARHNDSQRAAIHSAIADDAVESYGAFGDSLYGDNGIGRGGYGHRGVFSYPDGYGSPYFAGYYGPGDGADLGPLGHAYSN